MNFKIGDFTKSAIGKITSAPGAIKNDYISLLEPTKQAAASINRSADMSSRLRGSKFEKAKHMAGGYARLGKDVAGSLSATSVGVGAGAIGAIGGGAYGAISDDTSILGGMAAGATVGLAGGYGTKKGIQMWKNRTK